MKNDQYGFVAWTDSDETRSYGLSENGEPEKKRNKSTIIGKYRTDFGGLIEGDGKWRTGK